LIEGIYLEFLIQKTVLEQNHEAVPESVRQGVAFLLDTFEVPRKFPNNDDYTPDGLAAYQSLAKAYTRYKEEEAFTDLANPNPERDFEQQITGSYLGTLGPAKVTVRTMLLPNEKTAKQLETQIRSDADFERLARKYSLVRATLGGAYGYTNSQQPQPTSIEFYEPELQVGITQFAQKGMIRIPAPFSRMWLVSVLDVSELNRNLIMAKLLTKQQIPIRGGLFASGERSTAGYEIRNLGDPELNVEMLDPNVIRYNPTVASSNGIDIGISSLYALNFFTNDVGNFEVIESKMNQQIDSWLQTSILELGLPLYGAGAEYGLENYLAARVKVNETQIKSHYANNLQKYSFKNNFEQITCKFSTRDKTEKIRKQFISSQDDAWERGVYDFRPNCNPQAKSEASKLPEPPSRLSLEPVAGGFVTRVLGGDKNFYFLVIKGYHPKPLLKPFNLVAYQVEQDYRRIVARKQLPAFEQALRKRTNPQNLLKQAMRELENAGK
jgi:hypothetical protein